MLRTVEAEIDIDGQIRLLEPLHIQHKSRVLVTLLENKDDITAENNAGKLSKFLESSEFKNRQGYSAAEIEVQIAENRNSWE